MPRATILSRYLEDRILAHDPFQTLDQPGVGELMRIAIERGGATRPELQLGICGEHGGDPVSIASATGSVSTTSPPRPTGRRRPAWPAAQSALAAAGVGEYVQAGG